MLNLISNIQDIILTKKKNTLDNLVYKAYVHTKRPTDLENTITFNYYDHISNPPPNSSDQTKEELNNIVINTKNLRPEVIDTILAIDKDPLIIYKAFLETHQLSFPQEHFNQLYNVLYQLIQDVKIHFNRPRPNQIAEFYNINIPIINTGTHHTPSYPSGHVAYATLAEILLSRLYPQFTNDFIDITNKVKLARIKQGVHFSSDNIAAYNFVYNIYDKLLNYVHKENTDVQS